MASGTGHSRALGTEIGEILTTARALAKMETNVLPSMAFDRSLDVRDQIALQFGMPVPFDLRSQCLGGARQVNAPACRRGALRAHGDVPGEVEDGDGIEVASSERLQIIWSDVFSWHHV